ncbi:DUF2721 domain-containing protein [Aquidulcibacter sp.]|jgi:hypothetical protein|uniref:DUF2721 domain-containing protein n=1 Tax=Aquidulcibacter sp. TaxID=2052990 RepID=UPI00078EC262|nr:DUF2721 domain-containing protein [Aquidulcibacter sp.]AMS29360.1 hypothetical protein AEM38_07660 [Hyphomonadaceae bacterium UKL13-1]MCE2892369.1 DUF2721 domain-containing protein [Hyphomonadaceae bacterium]OYU50808.1 MAG: hypothetical protein CFE27_15030 [Alphaproteobacteria bacterium PA1]MCA3695653.1 DUF2721 domain-containing protein [Aquidulcibacter sp.]MCZ8207614.1 DUF2721 domain-containing protein [Aquidulcibacter sp.]
MPIASSHDIVQIIQLSIAPVFLIAGIGTLLNVLTSRLARVVDRGRVIEQDLDSPVGSGVHTNRHLAELRVLDQRMNWIHNAITLSTTAILLVCLLIVALFSVELIAIDLSRVVAVLFIATMASLIGGLISFLIEISYARKSLRVRAELLASRAPHH